MGRAVGIGVAVVVAAPFAVVAGAAALAVAPLAAAIAAPVVAGVAVSKRIERARAQKRFQQNWKDWREKEIARRHELGLPAFGEDPPRYEEPEDEGLDQYEQIEMQELNAPIASVS